MESTVEILKRLLSCIEYLGQEVVDQIALSAVRSQTVNPEEIMTDLSCDSDLYVQALKEAIKKFENEIH